MSKKDDKYGYYYHELVKYEPGIYFSDLQETEEIVNKMISCGVTEVYVDVRKDSDYCDTLFFGTNDKTNFKELLSIVMSIRPDEFSEETPYHYRMWFD